MIAMALSPTKQSGALQTVVPGASPYSWTNPATNNQLVMVGGGTVTLIEVAQDGVTFLASGLLAGVFMIKPGGKVRITYTIIPTFVNVIDF